jgi:hypothetical protein
VLLSAVEAEAASREACQQRQASGDDYDFQKHQCSHLRFLSLRVDVPSYQARQACQMFFAKMCDCHAWRDIGGGIVGGAKDREAECAGDIKGI